MPIRPTPRGSAICASTTPGSSGKAPQRGQSAEERLSTHAEHGVAAGEDIEVHRIAVVGGGIREPADIAPCDRLAHPFDERAPIRGRANVPKAPQAGAGQASQLGVPHTELGGLPRASLRRLRHVRSAADRRAFVKWVSKSIARRNVCGLANPAAHNSYPVDLDVLTRRHAVLGMSREALLSALPALRGFS